MLLVGLFAAVALLLSLTGVYGVVAYVVARRRREIGIRKALGAEGARVAREFLRRGSLVVAFGVVLGILAALATTRLMTSMLFGVSPTDPLTFAAIAVLITGTALLATWVPARRAAGVSVMDVLREE